MKIILHKNFEKQYQKLRLSEKKKFQERRNIFLKNPFHPILYNHSLHGEYASYRSINITGDLRVLYEPIDEQTAHFIAIGRHKDLYSE